ncbi:hypothetical protein GWK47_044704 [Chionoecetes opilio]|uniref:Uncharacterized protein n=1 Tax=Chionoecetes opilio TaxID=41210 RepID=A0A8J4YG73_CHIOP|nr:hypothetical protein GWK47_044704 [Chionoecetes opilio]
MHRITPFLYSLFSRLLTPTSLHPQASATPLHGNWTTESGPPVPTQQPFPKTPAPKAPFKNYPTRSHCVLRGGDPQIPWRPQNNSVAGLREGPKKQTNGGGEAKGGPPGTRASHPREQNFYFDVDPQADGAQPCVTTRPLKGAEPTTPRQRGDTPTLLHRGPPTRGTNNYFSPSPRTGSLFPLLPARYSRRENRIVRQTENTGRHIHIFNVHESG